MANPPILDVLKKSVIDDPIDINQIFHYLINELKSYLKLDVVNKKVKIQVVGYILKSGDSDTRVSSYGVDRLLKEDTYHIKLYRNYEKFFPFLLLQSAYLVFTPNKLKKTKMINSFINRLVENDLHELNTVTEWKSFTRERYIDYPFRFDKFLELVGKKSSENPIQFFFEFIRRYPNLSSDENSHFFLESVCQEFDYKSSSNLQSNENVETLRILTKIFYRIKNCDNLTDFCNHFNTFKQQGIIKTELSSRRFRRNLGWINKFSEITPTYYFDWKSLNMAVIICHLKFNPLLEKAKIDKIISQMPFIIMQKLAIANFAVEFSGSFVIPRFYVKDLIYLLEKMEQYGYLIKKNCSMAKSYIFSLNLNYFKEFYQNGQIINFKNRNYSKDNEIEFIQNYNKDFSKLNFTLLDFFILDRIRFFSYVGINFSRRKEISNVMKSDFSDFYFHENDLIKELENTQEIFFNSPKLRNEFLKYLERNQNFGFFYIKNELEKWVNYFQIIEERSKDTVNNITQFREFYEKEKILQIFEEDGIYDNLNSNSYIYKNLFLNYLSSNEKHKIEVGQLRIFSQFVKLCSNLKIFNVKSIKRLIIDLELLKEIIKIKKDRLKDLKKNIKTYNISNKTINLRINDFLNKDPKIIKPYLIDTVRMDSISSYFPLIVLKNSPEVKVKLNEIKNYFPRVYYYETADLFNKQEFISVQLFLPYLKNKEKKLFVSILFNLFKENIISFKRYFWSGYLSAFSIKDFYDFNKKQFYYTKDLFEQYFLYIKGIFGEDLTPFKEKSVSTVKFWSTDKNMTDLLKKVRDRIYSEHISFNSKDINSLSDFHLNLEKYLLDKEKLDRAQKEGFFNQYVKSIKIFPVFQNFGLGQYFLHISPFDLEEIDFKTLFTNSFQKIKHSASIGNSNSLFIKYIFPYGKPNTSYINWLKDTNKIRDYCLFYVKSISQILHFNQNLTSNGWNLEAHNFKSYVQNILFDSELKIQNSKVKFFNVGDLEISDYHKPDSSYFKAMTHLYNWHSVDIKKKLNIKDQSFFKDIQVLIREKLAFPYITLKNLDFKEIINIILLNPKKETIELLKNIFYFFNFGYLYEITGEYCIHGFNEKRKISNGLMVKLYLPDCEFAEFLRIFEYVFQYLKVEKYLILTDMVQGDSLISSVYGDNNFLKKYNPLKNLIWNTKTKRWMNNKLVCKDFDCLYPELIYEEKEGNVRTVSN